MAGARTPRSRRGATARSGRRPAGRPVAGPGRAGKVSGRPSTGREPARPVPFERGRAGLLLAGLFVFTLGFAVAGVLVTLGQGGRVPYLIAVTAGLMGIGVTGFGMSRGTAPMPEAAIWSPTTLRLLSAARDLPAAAVMAVLYVLGAVGVLGNLVVPLATR